MSVIIKGMKMPKSCDSCDLIQFDDEGLEAHCPLSPYYRWCGTPPDYIPEGCRLVEIPTPLGRLIDADRLMEVIEKNSYLLKGYYNSLENGMFLTGIKQAIDEAPTVIDVEVSE